MANIALVERTAPPLPIDGLQERLGYRPREIARLTGLAPATIYKWIEQGDLRASRMGRSLIVPAEEVRRLLGGSAA